MLSIENKLFKNYNYLLSCKHKQKIEIDITNQIVEFTKYMEQIEISLPKDKIISLVTDIIIYSILFMNSNTHEVLLDLFTIKKLNLEPEQELLILTESDRILEDIKKYNNFLKNIRVVMPYDIKKLNGKVYLNCLLCLKEGKNENNK